MMAGSMDIVRNLFTPLEVANNQTGLDETFKTQVRMSDAMQGGVAIEDYIAKMDRSGIERSLPREVEEFLFRLPGVADASVVGVSDEYWGEAGKAFLVMRPGASIEPAAVLAACKQSLAGYKVPRHVAFIDGLPRNAAGKVLKTELRKLT